MQENGLIDLEVLKAAIRPDTIVVSVMFVEQRSRRGAADRRNRRDLP